MMRTIAAFVLAASVIACSAGAVPTVTPSATARATLPSASPAMPSVPTATAGPSPSPSSTVDLLPPTNDPLSQSDRFWATWTEPILGHLTFDATSLAEATEQADLIIRGPLSELYVGETWVTDNTPYPLDYVKVQVTEVLKGEPHSRTPGFVEVQMGTVEQDELDETRAKMPTHDHLWFLMYEPNWAARGGSPMASAEIAPYAYFASNEYQGVFRDIGGAIRLVQPQELARILGPDHFPLALQNTDFEDLVQNVRELASGPSSAAAACTAMLEDVPDAELRSGEATLAAAFDVKGIQLATYMEMVDGGGHSTWRDQPDKDIRMCLFDGDFNTFTSTPGPEYDTSAVRVLVLVVDGQADLWALAKEDTSVLPAIDPASLPQEAAPPRRHT